MKTPLLFVLAAFFVLSSCENNDNDDPRPDPEESYINTNAGSTWTYHETSNYDQVINESDYTVTATNKDTTINNKKYHIYNYSYGGSQYLGINGADYYEYDSLPGGLGQIFERLYLKDNAAKGATWSQELSVTIPNFPVPVPLKVTNTLMDKGISHTVNNQTYTDVIYVSTKLSSSLVPEQNFQSDIRSYFTKNYGLIENVSNVSVDFMGVSRNVAVTTRLLSASLK